MNAMRLMTAILIVSLASTAVPATAGASAESVNVNGGGELQARPIPARPIAVLPAPPPTYFTRAMVHISRASSNTSSAIRHSYYPIL